MTDTPQTVLPADHEARTRAASPGNGIPLRDAIVALDTLAILAGIPAPGSTVHITDEAALASSLTGVTREQVAAQALRRASAWANALVAALPKTDTQEN